MNYLDIKSINEIIESSQIGSKIENQKLFENSKDLEKYLNTSIGLNLTIADVEGIIKSKETDFTTLQPFQQQPTILEKLGVNIFDSSLSGVDGVKVSNLTNLSFEFVEEGQEAQGSLNSVPYLQYKNNFVYGVIELQKGNLIGKTPEQINEWLLIESKKAIHTAIFEKLVSKISALDAVSGYDSIDTAKVYGLSDFNALETANGGEYDNLKYLINPSTARTLKTTDSGYNQPILKDRLVNDLQTYVRNEVVSDSVILGDFSKVGVLIHGINVLTDQYTKSNEGIIQMKIITQCDLHLLDSDSFTVGKNFS